MRRRKQDSVREKLSISQQYLADYLGISRSLLAMYEKNLRSLPTKASLKLAELELIYYRLNTKTGRLKTAPSHPEMERHTVKTKKAIKAHAATCNYKIILLQHKLDTMINEHSKALMLQQLLDELESPEVKKNQRSLENLWIQVLKNEALKKMIRHGEISRAKLQAELEVLAAAADIYNRLHESI